jgi:hypothetical protein
MTRRLIAATSLAVFAVALFAGPAAAIRPGHACPPAVTSQLVAAGESCHDLGMPVCQSAPGCMGTVAALQPVVSVLRIAFVSHQSATPIPAALHDLFEAGPPTPPPNC